MVQFDQREIIIIHRLEVSCAQGDIRQDRIGNVFALAYTEIKIRQGRDQPLPTAPKAFASCGHIVFMLDEFEKAHPAIHDRLLPLIDEGQFVNGAGEMVSCRSNIIIATSNTGVSNSR